MASSQEQPGKVSRGKTIAAVGLITFALAIILTMFFCQSRIQLATQTILNRQKDIQQAWLDKTLDSIRVWQAELVSQARKISSSEMFRLFMADAASLSSSELERLASPDSLHSPDDNLRGLAEQHAYIQDLLKDLTQRRAWSEARIVNAAGQDIVTEEFATPLTENQKMLVQEAVKAGQPVFGPIRQNNKGFALDIADPLFEVMGMTEPQCIGCIILTVPVDRILTTFLTAPGEQNNRILSRIVDKGPDSDNALFMRGNYLQMEPLKERLAERSLPFGERENLAGTGQVYSLGAAPANLNWLMVVETPESFVKSAIESEEFKIYGLGVLASVGIALAFAFAWAILTSRAHKNRARVLEDLNTTISQQKKLLDSVNSSLKAGMVLLNANGYILVCNPAFCKICGVSGEQIDGRPLAEVMRGSACTEILQAMAQMLASGSDSKWLEVELPNEQKEPRLYRVHLMPYESLPGEKLTNGNGCVAIFEDITVFRANAKKRRQREKALLAAFDSAMASADPDLVGQTFKIDSLAVKLADDLKMTDDEKETLRIGAMLTQIGKLFIPRELLHKKGKFTDEEIAQVREATKNADAALGNYDFGLPVQQTLREMNERMDGRGPMGLKGDQISLAGRVLAVANAFIALTNPRSWRDDEGKTIEEALTIIAGDKGFDPKIASALAKMDLAELYKSAKCDSANG
ncbi:MAG: PAS domain-containing protein [Desulfovibrio sp.]|nr:PAS domain-containing protein [Desulfovibrio sp.]